MSDETRPWKLTPMQFQILKAFSTLDPKGEYQYNAWYPALAEAIFACGREAGIRVGAWQQELPSLVRRGLLLAEGRSSARQYGISKDGLAAIQ